MAWRWRWSTSTPRFPTTIMHEIRLLPNIFYATLVELV